MMKHGHSLEAFFKETATHIVACSLWIIPLYTSLDEILDDVIESVLLVAWMTRQLHAVWHLQTDLVEEPTLVETANELGLEVAILLMSHHPADYVTV